MTGTKRTTQGASPAKVQQQFSPGKGKGRKPMGSPGFQVFKEEKKKENPRTLVKEAKAKWDELTEEEKQKYESLASETEKQDEQVQESPKGVTETGNDGNKETSSEIQQKNEGGEVYTQLSTLDQSDSAPVPEHHKRLDEDEPSAKLPRIETGAEESGNVEVSSGQEPAAAAETPSKRGRKRIAVS